MSRRGGLFFSRWVVGGGGGGGGGVGAAWGTRALLTWSRVPVQPITEYLRARRHWLIWCLKATAASRRRACAWSCSWVDRGNGAVLSSSQLASLLASLLFDLMITSSVVAGSAILSRACEVTGVVKEKSLDTDFDRIRVTWRWFELPKSLMSRARGLEREVW